MKSHRTLCTLTAFLLAMGVYSYSHAQAAGGGSDDTNVVRVISKTDKDEAVVSMTFDEAPLSDVIKAFRDATGANIISSGTNLQQTVSVRLDNVPWQKGLTSILEPQGMQLVEKPAGSGIYLVEIKSINIPTVTKTFQLANARAEAVAELFTNVLGEKGTATAFPSANTVIVTAPEKEINECELIIKAIDAPRQQVYIEARFVEMTAGADKSLGIHWDSLGGDGWGASFDGAKLDYSSSKTTERDKGTALRDPDSTTIADPVTGAITILPATGGPVPYRSVTGNDNYSRNRIFTGSLSMDAFKLAMNAFEKNDGVSIFSNPKIIVSNEENAKIDMTTKEPNVEVNYQAATTAGQRDSVSTKLGIIPGKEEPFVGEAFFSYGITLKVTPRVSSSGLITVKIEPSISDKVGDFTIQGLSENMPASRFPIINMRRIQTVFTLQDGHTAVIGGLSRTRNIKHDTGIPFLKDIPWIGPRLFGWKSHVQEQKEIVIFVTVGIADPVTIEEDAGMPRNAILSKDVMNGKIKEPYRMNSADRKIYDDKITEPKSKEDEATESVDESTEEVAEDAAEAVAQDSSKEKTKEVTEKAAAQPQPILAN